MFRYDRFAAGQIKGAEDPEQYEVDEKKGLIKIDWPPFNKADKLERELSGFEAARKVGEEWSS